MNVVLRVEKLIADWRADLDARGIVATSDDPDLRQQRRVDDLAMSLLRLEAMHIHDKVRSLNQQPVTKPE